MNEQVRQWVRYLVDYAALVVFACAYFLGGRDFQRATAALVVASVVAVAVGAVVERRVAWLPLFVGAAAVVFGGLSLVFHAPWILKIKPTIINLLLAGVLFGGLAIGKNPLKGLLGGALSLPDEAWRKLTIRFGGLYLVLAVLNVVIWRTQSEATWVAFRTFGLEVMTVLFALTQVPLLLRYMKVEDLPPPPTD